jgi:voltage-gated potassium channel
MARPWRNVKSPSAIVFALLLVDQVFTWGHFFFYERRGGSNALADAVPLSVIAILIAIIWTIRASRIAERFAWPLAAGLAFTFKLAISAFTQGYWQIGTTSNFSASLSRLDAVYFTLGVMSTAGTGSIAPVSQLARGLVALQMTLDLILIVVAAAVVVTRLAEGSRTRR